MFYIILWLTMFVGWIVLIAYVSIMESRDRAANIAERTGQALPVIVTVIEEEEEPRAQLAHA